MTENSEISWTENTFNPWIGCTKVSPGCANCYAERDWGEGSRRNRVKWGPHGTRSVTSEDNWAKPLRWNKQAEKSGKRIKVFCASLADVFEDWGGGMSSHRGFPLRWPTHAEVIAGERGWPETNSPERYQPTRMTDVRARLFALIDQTPHLDWLLVTKRPENIRTMWPVVSGGGTSPNLPGNWSGRPDYRKNVWLLTSVENQEQADKRIPELLKCRDLAPVLGLSCEPLLGPVDLGYIPQINRNAPASTDALTGITYWPDNDIDEGPHLDWVIAGGESGSDARPMHPDWPRSLRDQCQAAGVPFHLKQCGEFAPLTAIPYDDHAHAAEKHTCVSWNADEETWRVPPKLGETAMYRVGKKAAGRMLDGREWDEFPKVGA